MYLKENGLPRSLKFGVLRVPPIQISTQNGEMKVCFNKFHHRINLVPLLCCKEIKLRIKRIFKFGVLKVPSIQIPTQNGKMTVLFNKFHRRINLVALLLGNSGSRYKNTFSEFRILEILRVFSYKI
jgi:hypothetical protein